MSGGRVRGELAAPLRSRLGEDEDGKLKAEARARENFERSDESKEQIQRLLSSSPHSLFCFIFAFILVFVSRLIFFFLLAMAAIPTARRPPAPSDGAFFVFFFPPRFHPHHKGMGLIKKGKISRRPQCRDANNSKCVYRLCAAPQTRPVCDDRGGGGGDKLP